MEEFNKIKNILYKKEFEKLPLPELAELILKKIKTKEDKEVIEKLFIFSKAIRQSLLDFGTKILELNTDIEVHSSESFSPIKNLEENIKEILFLLDSFIDALAALNKIIEYKESRLELKKAEYYLKSIREKLLEKVKEYRLLLIKKKDFEEEFKHFLNDLIDIIIRTAYKLRIIKLYDKLKTIVK